VLVTLGSAIPLDRALLGIAIWVGVIATARSLVLARVAQGIVSPGIGAVILGSAMALAPWIFFATGALPLVIGPGLLVSAITGIYLAVRSVGPLRSERDKHRDAGRRT
jgi:hypothetical protein